MFFLTFGMCLVQVLHSKLTQEPELTEVLDKEATT